MTTIEEMKTRLSSVHGVDAKYVFMLLCLCEENREAKGRKSKKEKKRHYIEKDRMILELINYCETFGYVYGLLPSLNFRIDSVVFFELGDGTQISFHCKIHGHGFRRYDKPWKYDREGGNIVKLMRYASENILKHEEDGQ